METNQARTLAYTLAKELNHKDLGEVSGGAGGVHLCMEPSNYETNKSTMDYSPDYRVDF